jgi:hypothetical protein
MAPDALVVPTTSVVPLGRHAPMGEKYTCDTSAIGVGERAAVGDGLAAVGAALVAANRGPVGVGESAPTVPCGGPGDEHAAIRTATTADPARTRSSLAAE